MKAEDPAYYEAVGMIRARSKIRITGRIDDPSVLETLERWAQLAEEARAT